jgi:hypothetical protein
MSENPIRIFEEEPNSLEKATGCTKGEIQWWINQFGRGQELFNRLYSYDFYAPICFAPSYSDEKNLTTYVYELQQVVVTFNSIRNSIISRRQFSPETPKRVTTPHLSRIFVCTSPETMPIITGIEEQAHAYYHLVIEPSLSPESVKMTKLYDGSDSSEEFAFQSIIRIIFQNPDLQIDPLPKNLLPL